ncbi:16S rRNA (uracil(1498)-N(3))-methyltransferase [Tepidibacillus sp. HK-1]|uniref:16S rRNA (uracil(1498)-N(3))-methyltransferase n=1 Tax=Tepidibacillus sp. HK-1 TaxID=1883407 RepID=UPI00085391F1|nr:16S rRNA (uracil(1498)-N(3))-methyltransferase [Tepidibacillus sp. HK-1]GBF10129.1 ribosomal RNA small subunit methyltransferase E [Tepidibacillus sp. HK-1]
MQRYFVSKEQFNEDRVTILGDDAHHLIKVLRSEPGDQIICSNGEGLDVLAEITSIEAKQVDCRILSKLEGTREPKVEIILAQGLPKADKMDLIIQKGTEIGVKSFIPFTSERTIVQLNDKKEKKRLERWEKIAKEAAEQAQRSVIPNILPVHSWKELLQIVKNEWSLIAFEQESTKTLYQVLSNNLEVKRVLLIIGPEGGFSNQEVIEAENHGSISISLGNRILRTETAGLVGVANILYHLERG